jgi:HMG (high mobility group) box
VPLEEAWSLIQTKIVPGKRGKPSKRLKKTEILVSPRPKRALSAYLHFCAEKRPEVSATLKKLGDVSKKLALLWAETQPEDRKKYDLLAAAGKLEYEETLAQWEKGLLNVHSESKEATEGRKVKSRKATARSLSIEQEGDKAPRTASAYMLFCREYRPQMVDESGAKLPLGQATQRLAALWRECNVETREKFQTLAALEKEKMLIATSQ